MTIEKKEQKKILILWGKRVAAALTVLGWVFVLYQILQSGGAFTDQAPKCIISTMLIFGILTAVYKGLAFWEEKQ